MVGKTGRNEDCPCGSGKKHKKCCGRENKRLTQAGLLKVLQLVLDKADGLVVDCAELAAFPNKGVGVKYDADADAFIINNVDPVEKPLIQVARSMP